MKFSAKLFHLQTNVTILAYITFNHLIILIVTYIQADLKLCLEKIKNH